MGADATGNRAAGAGDALAAGAGAEALCSHPPPASSTAAVRAARAGRRIDGKRSR
jgi:hypothetical protein